ncbi:hydroxysqualene dehydroxylase HpnE [Paludibacterium paludis]|uniref:Amine oxidoreductase n=1 Tax=Paludibacterium paludis TaxID=1225769 RepID=A0A918P6Y1_9NEIS|nr:hydroxysqualene dehydroxylase HpnE [Paludibacterium paludis]GGY28410.1 amine oxidoreductase [Paludibacterium paludis]
MTPRVAIVGAGWSGLACAVELAGSADVTLFEAGREAGGRARRVETASRFLDNGQHILIGAYRDTLALMRKVGADPETLFERTSLRWYRPRGLRMWCPPLPAPLHLLAGLVLARGIGWKDKYLLARALTRLKLAGWRLDEDMPVSRWLARERQSDTLCRLFWHPLVLSAMNTPVDIASAQILANVLRDSLGGERGDSDLLLPRSDLSELFPLPACAWLGGQGVRLRFGERVAGIAGDAGNWRIGDETFDAVVLAVAPYHLDGLVDDEGLLSAVKAFDYCPIYTVYLQFPVPVNLPVSMCGVRDGAHWLFDRDLLTGETGMVAAVISAPREDEVADRDVLVRRLVQEVREIDPALPEPERYRIIVEKRATFAARVGLARPATRFGLHSMYLAGDWVASDYPATLEGAVRSGISAARALLHDFTQNAK